MELSNNTIADLKSSSKYLNSLYDWPIEIMSVSSEKQTGINELFVLLQKRWKWLQDKNILKKKDIIRTNYGLKKKLKKRLVNLDLNLSRGCWFLSRNPTSSITKLLIK